MGTMILSFVTRGIALLVVLFAPSAAFVRAQGSVPDQTPQTQWRAAGVFTGGACLALSAPVVGHLPVDLSFLIAPHANEHGANRAMGNLLGDSLIHLKQVSEAAGKGLDWFHDGSG